MLAALTAFLVPYRHRPAAAVAGLLSTVMLIPR
jgi:hypothetical protein